MGKNIERQILWYKYSDSNPSEGAERHYYNFLIINDKAKIKGIKQKLYGMLNPIIEKNEISEGGILGSKLSYELFCLQPYNYKYINFSGIYRGKVKFDRRLQKRKTKGGWNSLIEKVYAGEI